MTKTIKAILVVLGIILSINAAAPKKGGDEVLAEGRAIKGVWVATLYSMDYPKTPTQDIKELKADAEKLIKDAKDHGFNTVFLQVRPSGDAFYKSEIYPWSKYLTGELSASPDDGFDPLSYIIKEAHKEGIALHAWINPYRVTASEKDNQEAIEKGIGKDFSHIIVKHSDGKLYLNPGEPESIKLVTDGVRELIKNYDIDGIHIDDYFYPGSDFPDAETFTKYGGAFQNIGDWRRDNTLNLVKEIKETVKEQNPKVIFSVSPSGIWANKESNKDGSDTSGRQAYYDYYADTRRWVKEELIDMIIPQIYWNIGYSMADFETLVKWWSGEVEGTNVMLCIGQGIYKAAEETDKNSAWYGEKGFNEISKQLDMIKTLKNCRGFVQYRLGSITKTAALSEFIKIVNLKETELFSDTKDYPWAKDAIERLYKKGVVNGMGDGTFGCSLKISRADFTVMLVRMTEQSVPFADNFSDVSVDKYYFKEVGIAKVLGYVTGRDDNTFDPASKISREDMATIAFRVMKKTGKLKEDKKADLNKKFTDAVDISEYARLAVAVMVENGILSGYETGEFNPKGLATRAECAVLLDRLSKL